MAHSVFKGEDVEFPDDATRASVFAYVAYVRAHKSHDELEGVDHTNCQMLHEQRIVSEFLPDHGGTIDTLILSDNHIHVIDFKDGVMPVPSQNNKQLLSYLVLAGEKYGTEGKRFFGTIVQPRVFGTPQCVEFSLSELGYHLFEVTVADKDTTKKAGEHCRWCPLRHDCEVRDRKVHEIAVQEFDDGWSGEKCVDFIKMGVVIADMVEEAKAHIRKILMSGDTVHGWRLARQLSNRCWKDKEALVKMITDKGVKEEFLFNHVVKSPAQMEKALAKSYKPLLASFIHRIEKGIIAVETDSNLPEYVLGEEFDDINPEDLA